MCQRLLKGKFGDALATELLQLGFRNARFNPQHHQYI